MNKPSEDALKNFYNAIKPALIRIAKENADKNRPDDSTSGRKD